MDRVEGLIVDLGGGPGNFFAAMLPSPERVVLVEYERGLVRAARAANPALNVVLADGARLPFADQSIGLLLCNSVIEHVADPAALASEIRRVSRGYFVQTPCGDFPLETHSFFPIPLYRHLPVGRPRRAACWLFGGDHPYIESVRYLDEPQLRRLFPEATVIYEHAVGLRKSFYVYRRER